MKDLLINSLGGYEPKVCVSTFGRETWRGENGYYAAHTVANNLPDMKWEIDGDIKNVAEKIVKELEEKGFSCEIRNNLANEPVIDAIHIETAKAKERVEQSIAARRKTGEKGFIRFGDVPEDEKSYNYRDGFHENGVSVYNALFYPDGKYEILPENDIQVFGSISFSSRPVFRVWGDVVGTGSDGEPLLRNIYRKQSIDTTKVGGLS